MKLHLLCAALAAVALSATAADLPKPGADGWITLFNGKDLTGWNGNPEIWSVKDGEISGTTPAVKFNTFLIFERPFTNFVLKAKGKIIKGASGNNSGIQYRSTVFDAANWRVKGYQADMGAGWWGACYEEGGRGILWKPSAEATATAKVFEEWNDIEITADGTKISQKLNGVASGSLDDTNEAKRAASGIIALQFHGPGGFEVRFKDIQIKELP